jgi:hypothetical protein
VRSLSASSAPLSSSIFEREELLESTGINLAIVTEKDEHGAIRASDKLRRDEPLQFWQVRACRKRDVQGAFAGALRVLGRVIRLLHRRWL